MIKTSLLSVLLLATALISFAGSDNAADQKDQLYGLTIYRQAAEHPDYIKSVTDLDLFLEKITNRSFRIENYRKGLTGNGIYLVLNYKDVLTSSDQEKLEAGSIEDFVISGNGDKLVIAAMHPIGLSRGIYTYLDKLGIKWYFPGDQWTYLPQLQKITINTREYVSPSFALRDFFGTGGLFPVKGLIETEIVKISWEDWKRRNRMGGSVKLGGHYWETFNLTYKDVLLKNPQYLAEIKGKRTPWNVSAKFCISNKQLQQLFVADRIKYLNQQISLSVDKGEKFMIPVDPSDGGGHCECDQCRKMGTVSDRVFFLANLVAKAASAYSTNAFVNLYAYNEHAAPPSIKLEKNIMVQIIPYAFQNIGTPEEMISLWKKKSNNLYLYDYYGIPDWHFETPLTGRWSPGALMYKIRFWKQTGVKGFLLESSNGIGTTGLGLYLMSRLGWNASENPDQLVNQYYQQMFSAGKDDIKNYYSKINVSFREIADVPYLYQQLSNAQLKVGNDKNIINRIYALRSYVHYALLYYQYRNSKDPAGDGSWEKLMRYGWEIYPTMMVHTTRMTELLFQITPVSKELTSKWNLYADKVPGIHGTKWITNNTIEQYVKQDSERYKILRDFDYIQGPVQYDFVSSVKTPGKSTVMNFLVFPDLYIRSSSNGNFSFSLRTNPSSTKNEKQLVTLMLIDTSTGKTIWEEKRNITQEWSQINIRQQAGKIYQLYIKNTNWINVSFDNIAWFNMRNIPTYSYPGKLWFYIPKGKEYFYYKNTAAENPVLSDPDGKVAKPSKINNEGVHQVRVSKSGWWSIEKAELKFLEFYLYPGGFFSHPGYTVKEKFLP